LDGPSGRTSPAAIQSTRVHGPAGASPGPGAVGVGDGERLGGALGTGLAEGGGVKAGEADATIAVADGDGGAAAQPTSSVPATIAGMTERIGA